MAIDFEGIVNINKPEGITSFDVVSSLRRLFKIKRIGHCGTLDPFATGVLPICIGKATAAVRYMDSYDKSYEVKTIFGKKTDTQDKSGNTIAENIINESYLQKLRSNNFSELKTAINELSKTKTQIPPMYSAIKIDGKPLYKYAREGIEIKREPRNIEIYSIDLINITADKTLEATMKIDCSKGTYIRTICDDLGDMIGTHAYADSLIRTKCGPFSIENSISIEKLEELLENYTNKEKLFEASSAFSDVPFALSHFTKITLCKNEALRLVQGQKLKIDDLVLGDKPICVFDDENTWIGIARFNDNVLKAERIFIDVQDYIK